MALVKSSLAGGGGVVVANVIGVRNASTAAYNSGVDTLSVAITGAAIHGHAVVTGKSTLSFTGGTPYCTGIKADGTNVDLQSGASINVSDYETVQFYTSGTGGFTGTISVS